MDDDELGLFSMYVITLTLIHTIHTYTHTHINKQAARQKRGETIKRAEKYVKEYKKVRLTRDVCVCVYIYISAYIHVCMYVYVGG